MGTDVAAECILETVTLALITRADTRAACRSATCATSWVVAMLFGGHRIKHYLSAMKKCAYCGQENGEGATTCSGCGKGLALQTRETDPQLLDPGLSPVVVARFSNLQEASLLVARLDAAGIEAFIPEEYGEQVFSGVVGLERLTVRVAAKDSEAAKAIVAESGDVTPTDIAPGPSGPAEEPGPE